MNSSSFGDTCRFFCNHMGMFFCQWQVCLISIHTFTDQQVNVMHQGSKGMTWTCIGNICE